VGSVGGKGWRKKKKKEGERRGRRVEQNWKALHLLKDHV